MSSWQSDIVRDMARYNGWTPVLQETLTHTSMRLTFDRDGVRVAALFNDCATRKGDYIAQVLHADDEDRHAGWYRQDSYDENATSLLGLLATWFYSPQEG